MAPAWLVSVLITAAVVAVAERRVLRSSATPRPRRPHVSDRDPVGFAVAVVAVAAVTAAVLLLRTPAPAVMGIGVVAVLTRARGRDATVSKVLDTLGLPVLVGLFGVAVALGTLGRTWTGPAVALSHLDAWGTAGVAALASVAVNNLPAASFWRLGFHPDPSRCWWASTSGPTCS